MKHIKNRLLIIMTGFIIVTMADIACSKKDNTAASTGYFNADHNIIYTLLRQIPGLRLR